MSGKGGGRNKLVRQLQLQKIQKIGTKAEKELGVVQLWGVLSDSTKYYNLKLI